MTLKDRPSLPPQDGAWHFVGVGGVGMSGLAQVALSQAPRVTGSDRYLDLGQPHARLQKLRRLGVQLHPQDGSGVTEATARLVVSTAIEPDNPDLKRAAELHIPVIHRSQLLADIFHAAPQRVAVTGSCGKTTITAMVGWLLTCAGLQPTVINGGVMRNFEDQGVGNTVSGPGRLCVIEADESDGTCVTYQPTLGVLTGLARDHKEAEELRALYAQFAGRVQGTLVVNADDPAVNPLAQNRDALTYGFAPEARVRAEDVALGPGGSFFRVGKTAYRLPLIGLHNVHNALAALAVARALGVEAAGRDALAAFRGVERR
ncbi:MAG TPA: Mur ligase family protein, partial [Candidatus Brocadiia bacterium]|nr:Mur ligase family protein [Candidatus Brocadiia bacterium]